MKEIAIVGAGISGLICALELERLGYHPVIFDARSEVGGRLATERVLTSKGPVRVDRGFQVLLTAYPEVSKYLNLSKLNLNVLHAAASIHLSSGKTETIGDPLVSLRWVWPSLTNSFSTWRDLAKMFGLQRYVSRLSEEEIFELPDRTTRTFLEEWGFSDQLIQTFFQPFYAGIFLEDKLETSSRMFLFVFKMFAKGSAAIPKEGMEQVALQIKNQLRKTTFHLNKTIESAHALSHFEACAIPHTWGNEGEQEWNSCFNYVFELERTSSPINHLYLVPKIQGYAVNNYHYSHHSTPEGPVYLINATCLRRETPEKIKSELEQLTGAALLECAAQFNIPQALPAKTPMRATLNPAEMKAPNGAYYLGDSMLYPSLNAAMKSGRLVASLIHSDIQARSNEAN